MVEIFTNFFTVTFTLTRSHVASYMFVYFASQAHKNNKTNVPKSAFAVVHNFGQINDMEQAVITSRIRIQNKNFGLELTKESFESLFQPSNKQHQGL